MQFKEQEIWILIISMSTLLLFIAAVFFLLLLISRKRKLNYLQLIAEEKIKLQQAELLKKDALINERERIIKDLHDELGGSLNSVHIISDLILNQKPETEKILEYVSKISSTSKNISQQIKTVVWSLDAEKDTLYNLIEFIKQYATEFLEYSPIQLTVIDNQQANDLPVSGLFRKTIFLIVKEALNNIVKHANATEVKLTLSTKDNLLELEVQDNGVGIQKKNPFGNGLKNMEKRMREIDGDFKISNKNGTVIQINIALSLLSAEEGYAGTNRL